MQDFMFSRCIFAAYIALITAMSLRPANTMAIEPWDKLFHLLIYAIMALLAWRCVGSNRAYLWLCGLILVFSAVMEWGQSFMPGRVMSAWDLLANTIGVVAGMLLVKAYGKRSPPEA